MLPHDFPPHIEPASLLSELTLGLGEKFRTRTSTAMASWTWLVASRQSRTSRSSPVAAMAPWQHRLLPDGCLLVRGQHHQHGQLPLWLEHPLPTLTPMAGQTPSPAAKQNDRGGQPSFSGSLHLQTSRASWPLPSLPAHAPQDRFALRCPPSGDGAALLLPFLLDDEVRRNPFDPHVPGCMVALVCPLAGVTHATFFDPPLFAFAFRTGLARPIVRSRPTIRPTGSTERC